MCIKHCEGCEIPGGRQEIEWNDEGHVLMSGPISKLFEAELDDTV
jgi:diaminopimelate epimerase